MQCAPFVRHSPTVTSTTLSARNDLKMEIWLVSSGWYIERAVASCCCRRELWVTSAKLKEEPDGSCGALPHGLMLRENGEDP